MHRINIFAVIERTKSKREFPSSEAKLTVSFSDGDGVHEQSPEKCYFFRSRSVLFEHRTLAAAILYLTCSLYDSYRSGAISSSRIGTGQPSRMHTSKSYGKL